MRFHARFICDGFPVIVMKGKWRSIFDTFVNSIVGTFDFSLTEMCSFVSEYVAFLWR